MKKKFLLEIVTPEKIAFSEEVESVVVPSTMGEIGILAGHTPLFSQLVEGELRFRKNGEEFFLSIGGGFLEVTPEKVVVLVTRAVRAEELNEAAILRAKKEAEEALKAKSEGAQLEAAQALLRSTLVDLKVLRKIRKKRR